MYKFLLRIVSVLIKIIYRVRVNGIENFKDDEPIIISANHIHIFDPVILATLTKKQIFFLAKKELFDNALHTVYNELKS
ncbi:lysophospholipid acyltransferase family protein, partial [Parvimonas micra]